MFGYNLIKYTKNVRIQFDKIYQKYLGYNLIKYTKNVRIQFDKIYQKYSDTI